MERTIWAEIPLAIAGCITMLINILIAAAITGWQAFNWLQTGVWHPVPLMLFWRQTGIDPHLTEWIGLQKLIFQALDQPLALAIFIASGAIFGLLNLLAAAAKR